jgi:hypothetical protein
MSRADLQTATRRVRRMEELIEDQRRRLAAYEARGDLTGAERAAELLQLFEGTLAWTRHMAATRRRGQGAED